MGNNGLFDQKPCFSPACCFSWPVQCPKAAAAPVAYTIQHHCSYRIQRYNRINWLQNCLGKAAAGGCPPAPSSGARQRPMQAPARGACAAPTSQCWWHLSKRAGKPKARVQARMQRQKQSQTLCFLHCSASIIFCWFCQWWYRADRVILLIWTSDFHCFGALGVWSGARIRPHVLFWCMVVIVVIVEPPRKCPKSAWHMHGRKYLKKRANCEGFSTLTLQTGLRDVIQGPWLWSFLEPGSPGAQHPSGIEPKSPNALRLTLTTKPWFASSAEKNQYMTCRISPPATVFFHSGLSYWDFSGWISRPDTKYQNSWTQTFDQYICKLGRLKYVIMSNNRTCCNNDVITML